MRTPLCWRACPVITRREVWLPVTVRTRHRWGHQYQVSNLGRVRRVGPKGAVLLSTFVHATGYLAVSLGRRQRDHAGPFGGCHLVHSLVAHAFLGDPPRNGQRWEIDHVDYGRLNAAVTNLRWLPKDVNAWRWKRLQPLDGEVDPADAAELDRYNRMAQQAGYAV